MYMFVYMYMYICISKYAHRSTVIILFYLIAVISFTNAIILLYYHGMNVVSFLL